MQLSQPLIELGFLIFQFRRKDDYDALMQIPKLIDSHFRQASFIHRAHPLFFSMEGRLRRPSLPDWIQTMRSVAPSERRRYARKPTPAKPRIIIAQVVGSGTAVTAVTPDSSNCLICEKPISE